MGLNNLQEGSTGGLQVGGLQVGGLQVGGLKNLTAISEIPDSAIAQYDSTEDGREAGSITSIPDQYASFDLSGTAELVLSGINGNRTYRFDGVDDVMANPTINADAPTATIMVVQKQSGRGRYYDSREDNTGNRRQLDDTLDETDYRLFSGGDALIGGNPDTDPHIIVHRANASGTADQLEVDGTIVIDGDTGDGTIDEFALGTADGDYGEIDVGELIHYDSPTESDISDEKQRLSDKWGIAV